VVAEQVGFISGVGRLRLKSGRSVVELSHSNIHFALPLMGGWPVNLRQLSLATLKQVPECVHAESLICSIIPNYNPMGRCRSNPWNRV
jgi:hypothetical protein